MLFRALIVAVGIALLSGQAAYCEPHPDQNGGQALSGSVFGALVGGDVVRAADDFRKGSEALDRFGASLARIDSHIAAAAVNVSENLAAMSTGFDPFGFKTAFQTIQRQNEIVREQSATIQKLQQQEIKRLRKELKRSKRRT
jgi:hypothetical protein